MHLRSSPQVNPVIQSPIAGRHSPPSGTVWNISFCSWASLIACSLPEFVRTPKASNPIASNATTIPIPINKFLFIAQYICFLIELKLLSYRVFAASVLKSSKLAIFKLFTEKPFTQSKPYVLQFQIGGNSYHAICTPMLTGASVTIKTTDGFVSTAVSSTDHENILIELANYLGKDSDEAVLTKVGTLEEFSHLLVLTEA